MLVDRDDVDATLELIREEGVYDDDRRITLGRDGRLELPVTDRPPSRPDLEVIEQEAPEPRVRTLTDRLKAEGWTDKELERVPSSWAVIGTVVLVRLEDCPRPAEVGEALLDVHGGADTVLATDGVEGRRREPNVELVAGLGETETVHREHGTRYALDLASVMFSPGNQAERVRMGRVVHPDERVFDMFAGIGYFALPMARAGARVTAAELNPTAFGYLVENAVLNDVDDRIEAVLGDCRQVATSAERVVMGHFDAPDHLDAALEALEPSGVLHLHALGPSDDPWGPATERLAAAAAAIGRSTSVDDRRRVKGHSPGMEHVVVDATID